MASTTSNLVTASGYGNILNVLQGIYTDTTFIDQQCFEDAAWSSWANTNALEKLTCNSRITFNVVGQAEEWLPYEANQNLVYQTPDATKLCVEMCSPIHQAFKIDDLLNKMSCGRALQLTNLRVEKSIMLLKERFASEILARYFEGAASFNQGLKAGYRTANIDLGTPAQPVVVNGGNIISDLLSRIKLVAAQTKCRVSDMILVLPPEAEQSIMASPYSNNYVIGNCQGCSPLIGGEVSGTLMGMKVVFSNLLPQINLGAGNFAHGIVAFNPNAQLFRGGIYSSRVDEDIQGTKMLLLATSGGLVIHPQQVIRGVYSFQ
jgi:hypothetical protein